MQAEGPFGVRSALRAEPATQLGARHQLIERGGERTLVTGGHEPPRLAVAHDVGEPTGVEADDGSLGEECLDGGEAEPLVERRDDVHRRAPVLHRELRLREDRQPLDALVEAVRG